MTRPVSSMYICMYMPDLFDRSTRLWSPVYYFYALQVQRPFDISIFSSMKVLIMHLCMYVCTGTARDISISIYHRYIYTIYGAFICVTWSQLGWVWVLFFFFRAVWVYKYIFGGAKPELWESVPNTYLNYSKYLSLFNFPFFLELSI